MIIFAEIFEFVEYTCKYGAEASKERAYYRMMKRLMETMYDMKCGVPYFVLFDDDTYLDVVINYDNFRYNPSYDAASACIVFPDVNALFYGIRELLHTIRMNQVHIDHHVEDKYNQMNCFLKIVEDSLDMDILCDTIQKNL
jgi:hypothetical protein